MEKIADKVFSKYLMSNESLINFIPHSEKSKLYLGLTNTRIIVVDRKKGEKMNEIPLRLVRNVSIEFIRKRNIGLGIFSFVVGFFMLAFAPLLGLLLWILAIWLILTKQKFGKLILNLDNNIITFVIKHINEEELGRFATEIKEQLEKFKTPSPSPIPSNYSPPPPVAFIPSPQAKPFVDAVGIATIKNNGDVFIRIHTTTPATLLTARVDGTNYYSTQISPQYLNPGDTDVKIKLSPTPVELNPDNTYMIVLTAESLGNRFEIHSPARYRF